MFVEKVVVDGFLVFDSPRELILRDGVTVLTGPNGAGKSSIQQAVQWAITGETRIPRDVQSVIHKGSTAATVDVFFSHGGARYHVQRSRSSKAGSMDLFRETSSGWLSLTSGRNQKDLQSHLLENILGVTADTLHSLMFVDQKGDGNRFTGSKPEERRAILISMIPDLQMWDQHHRKLSDSLRVVRKEHDRLESTLAAHRETLDERVARHGVLSGQLDGVDIPALKKTLDVATKALNGALSGGRDTSSLVERLDAVRRSRLDEVDRRELRKSDLRATFDELRGMESTLEDLVRERGDVTADINSTNTTIAGLRSAVEGVENRLDGFKSKAPGLGERRDDLLSRVATAREVLSQSKARVDTLKEAFGGQGCPCPVCENVLTDDQVAGLLSESERAVAVAASDVDELSDQLSEAKNAVDALNSAYGDAVDELEGLNERIQSSTASVVNMKARLDTIQAKFTDLATRVSGVSGVLCSPLNVAAKVSEAVDKIRGEHNAVVTDVPKSDEEVELESAIRRASEDNPDSSAAQSAVDRAETALEEALALQASVSTVADDVASMSDTVRSLEADVVSSADRVKSLEVIREAASPKGVPSTLISSLLEDIATGANEIVSSLVDKPMFVSFSLEKTLKKGSAKPSLDIFVTSDGVTKIVESLSGGELAVTTLAIMLSMIRVVNQRGGSVVETLFLDEALSPLDKDRVPAVMSMLKNSGVVRSTVIVSHDTEIIGGADHVVRVPLSDTPTVPAVKNPVDDVPLIGGESSVDTSVSSSTAVGVSSSQGLPDNGTGDLFGLF